MAQATAPLFNSTIDGIAIQAPDGRLTAVRPIATVVAAMRRMQKRAINVIRCGAKSGELFRCLG